MELVMTEKQKEIFERLMAIPVMEYDLNDNLSVDVLMRWILELAQTAETMYTLMASPEISAETQEYLKKDFFRLREKQKLVIARFNEEIEK